MRCPRKSVPETGGDLVIRREAENRERRGRDENRRPKGQVACTVVQSCICQSIIEQSTGEAGISAFSKLDCASR